MEEASSTSLLVSCFFVSERLNAGAEKDKVGGCEVDTKNHENY
jgi:hypothetical protein